MKLLVITEYIARKVAFCGVLTIKGPYKYITPAAVLQYSPVLAEKLKEQFFSLI